MLYVELENLWAAATATESEIQSEVSMVAVTQFVNIVSTYTPFHSVGLIKVAFRRWSECQQGEVEVLIRLKTTEVKILPFTVRNQTGINTIMSIPIVELSSSISPPPSHKTSHYITPGDMLMSGCGLFLQGVVWCLTCTYIFSYSQIRSWITQAAVRTSRHLYKHAGKKNYSQICQISALL